MALALVMLFSTVAQVLPVGVFAQEEQEKTGVSKVIASYELSGDSVQIAEDGSWILSLPETELTQEPTTETTGAAEIFQEETEEVPTETTESQENPTETTESVAEATVETQETTEETEETTAETSEETT